MPLRLRRNVRPLAACILLATATMPLHAQCPQPTWSPLGSGIDGFGGFCVAEMPNGDVVAGGSFLTAGGTTVNGVARWNGTTWTPLGTGVSGWAGSVYSIAVLTTGEIVAGGPFTTAGGVNANSIALWNGSNWSSLGSAASGDPVPGAGLAIVPLPTGGFIAGGDYLTSPATPTESIAHWDGTTWLTLGGGLTTTSGGGSVRALARAANGDIYAGGEFSLADGNPANNIARWDGSAWHPLGAGVDGHVACLIVRPNDDLIGV